MKIKRFINKTIKWFGAVSMALIVMGAAPEYRAAAEPDSVEARICTKSTLAEFAELPDRGQFVITDSGVLVLQPVRVIRSAECRDEHSFGSIIDLAIGFEGLMIHPKPLKEYTP